MSFCLKSSTSKPEGNTKKFDSIFIIRRIYFVYIILTAAYNNNTRMLMHVYIIIILCSVIFDFV